MMIRGMRTGRLGAIGALFCAVPPLLVASPELLATCLPVLVATFASAALGLLGAHSLGALWARRLAILGLAGLATAPAFGGLSVVTAAVAALSVVLELLAARRAERRILAGLGAVVIGLAVAAVVFGPQTVATVEQGAIAALLLPVAPVLILVAHVGDLRRAAHLAAEQQRASRQREDVMLAAADVAVTLVDRSGQVLDATTEAARLLMQGPLALDGRGFIDRVLIADRPAFLNAVAGAALDGLSQTLRLRLAVGVVDPDRPAPPTFGVFELHIRPVAGTFGEAAVVIARAGDEAAPESLLSVAGPGLFSTLSHEIRTPMNAILGFSEILANEALAPRGTAQVAEYAGIIHRSARDAFSVTRSVVDLLRVEAGEFVGETETIHLSEVIGGVFAGISSREPDGACTFDIEAAMTEDAVVMAEPRALRMLVSAVAEGLLTAQNGAADMVCAITSADGRPAVTITARPRACVLQTPHKHAALMAVVTVLVRRLATVLGADVEFDPPHGARMIFGAAVPAPVRRHRPAQMPAPSASIPLRKSA